MNRALFVALSLVACQHSENRYARRDVAATELTGRWVLTSFGLKSLADVGVKDHLTRDDHVLLLSADGSCVVRTVFGLPAERHEYRVYDSGCTWHLGRIGHQAVQLLLTPEPRTGNPYFYLAEEHGRIIIWQYATDPDEWRYLEFERAVEQQDAAAGAGKMERRS